MRMTRGVVVRYVSAGGRGLPSQAGWPFARIEVSGGEARTRLFRTGMAIPSSTPVEVREPTSQFGKRAIRTELRFQLASPQTGVAIVEILFHDRDSCSGRRLPRYGKPVRDRRRGAGPRK